jgi:hypothetical protein
MVVASAVEERAARPIREVANFMLVGIDGLLRIGWVIAKVIAEVTRMM